MVEINIAIELLVIIFFILVIIVWLILKWITRLILLWRYKPEYDKGKRIGGTSGNVATAVKNDSNTDRLEGRSILQTSDAGESRKNSNSIRNLLKRRRK